MASENRVAELEQVITGLAEQAELRENQEMAARASYHFIRAVRNHDMEKDLAAGITLENCPEIDFQRNVVEQMESLFFVDPLQPEGRETMTFFEKIAEEDDYETAGAIIAVADCFAGAALADEKQAEKGRKCIPQVVKKDENVQALTAVGSRLAKLAQ